MIRSARAMTMLVATMLAASAASAATPTPTATPAGAATSPCGLNAYELGPKGLATARVPIHGCDDIAHLSAADRALFWQTRAAIRALPEDAKSIPPLIDEGARFLSAGERLFVSSVKASAALEDGVDDAASANAAKAIPLPPGPGIGAPPDCHLSTYELGPKGLRTARMAISSCEDVGRLTAADRSLFYQVRKTVNAMTQDATEVPAVLQGDGAKFLTAGEVAWVNSIEMSALLNASPTPTPKK